MDQFGPEEYVVSPKKEEIDDKVIQIVDLHSHTPLISYAGTVYTCQWSTTIGTDMFFAKRPKAPTTIDDDTTTAATQPLLSLKRWDLLGLSATRLLATEAKLTHKNAFRQNTPPENIGNDGPQGAFLRRFVDLKVKKGEIPADEQPAPNSVAHPPASPKSEALRAMYLGHGVQQRSNRGRKPRASRVSTASLVDSMSGALQPGSGTANSTPGDFAKVGGVPPGHDTTRVNEIIYEGDI